MKNFSNENIIHMGKNGIQYLQFRRLLNYDLKHCFTLKPLDFSILNSLEGTLRSYSKVCDATGINFSTIIKPIQDNMDRIKCVESKVNIDSPDINLEEYKYIDGLITDKHQIALSTTGADCFIVLMYDPIKKVIANTHSGWRGTLKRISEKALIIMREKYGCDFNDIICCITPGIRKCHFEVDEDIKILFQNEFKEIDEKQFIEVGRLIEQLELGQEIKKQKYHIDMPYIIRTTLKNIGIKEENIIDSNICSVCENEYIHSKRGNELSDLEVGTAIIQMN